MDNLTAIPEGGKGFIGKKNIHAPGIADIQVEQVSRIRDGIGRVQQHLLSCLLIDSDADPGRFPGDDGQFL